MTKDKMIKHIERKLNRINKLLKIKHLPNFTEFYLRGQWNAYKTLLDWLKK